MAKKVPMTPTGNAVTWVTCGAAFTVDWFGGPYSSNCTRKPHADGPHGDLYVNEPFAVYSKRDYPHGFPWAQQQGRTS